MTEDSNIIDMFDHLCWYLCDSQERFVPPEETAKSLADRGTGEMEEAESRGYHRGALAQFDGVIDFIEMYDIDVEERTRVYIDESDNDIDPPRSRDELKAIMADE